ncbi:MAG TPA: asparagine synthase (glutamine-hydrolyzing) [Gemmatimonadaceae bacterium]|nr:asparagine synthase (glutamine-hydrolyzing) [Gemmatimonadaceae bacterium]
MCGIVGVLGTDRVSRDAVGAMLEVLRHRGPDDGDVWQDEEVGISLGHRRLSILDLSAAGHQPMISHCQRYVISLNGEIYNHLELRQALERAHGPLRWNGHSDTETFLACVSAWGVRQTLESSVGMFAVALWDRGDRRLHLARDRFGEKPLYYGWVGGGFVFASELGALRKHPRFANPVDRDVVALYLQFGYVPAPYSIYRDVYKVEAGCILSISLADDRSPPAEAPFAPSRSGGFAVERYWSLADIVARGLDDPIGDERQAVEQLEATLSTAVRLQSVADVPLGAFLSGGIDSSTVVALMQAQARRPVRTFTIGFAEDGFNEAVHAKAVARHLGTEHTELYVTPELSRSVIPRLPDLYSEPFADASQIPTFLVAEMTRQHVTVALSGDAGDELFGGYNRYSWGRRIWSRLSWLPPGARGALGAVILRIPAPSWDALGTHLPRVRRIARLGDKAHKLARRLMSVNSTDDLYRSLVTEWEPDSGVVRNSRPLRTLLDDPTVVQGVREAEHRMMLRDAMTYLPDDILQKVDRAAMGVSLETRVPFLDHRVAELAWRIPLHLKIRDGQGKWVLRQVLHRHVPRELVERPKAGFGVPVGEWLRAPLRDWAEDLLSESRLAHCGLLEPAPVREKLRQHLAGTHDWTPRLWSALMLQAWAGRNLS